jgi:hypothetical protein
LQGHTADGERVIYPAFDTPIQIASPFPSKEALERAQLEKYRLDHLLHFGKVPFEEVERGGDPPDFLVSRRSERPRTYSASWSIKWPRTILPLFGTWPRRR